MIGSRPTGFRTAITAVGAYTDALIGKRDARPFQLAKFGLSSEWPSLTTGNQGGIDPSADIHPTARIDPTSVIGPGVRIGPDAFVGPQCSIGPNCFLHERAIIVRRTTMGEGNVVHPYAVLGGDPQDRSYKPDQPGELVIGDRNVFREGSTFHRGNWNGPPTRIGSNGYFMVQSHLGHNAQAGDFVTLANAACLAGHASLGSYCVMSAFSAIHQFCSVGEGVMFQACGRASMHVPPWVIVAGTNQVAGLNAVGIRRNPTLTPQDRVDIKRVYRVLYRQRKGSSIDAALTELEGAEWSPAARRFIDFIRTALNQDPPRRRGVCGGKRRHGPVEEAHIGAIDL